MSEDINVFGVTTYRGQARKFGIKTDDRRRHMYLVGKTGMGKSTILENMIINDIRAGHGVAVVDPHGDLAEKIIEFIPTERINDVVYFNPADIEYPIALNVIEQVEPHLRHLVASGLIGVFQKMWADSWGPRLEYILRNAILAILDYPGATLLAVVRMLSDKPFRKKVIEKIQDPVVKAFWVNEFAGYADKFASEAVSPIQNKVGQFLSSSLMRNIVGQAKSSINLRDIMDGRKILIMNLSKGRIGEDNSALLGAMMITKIQLAAMSRVDMPEKDRKDFYLYIDEFQNFMTDSFANILSEARKYHLNLIMAHQYIEQLSEKVAPAVFGNVGTMVVFRVGAADAEELVKEFTPVFEEEDLVNLPKYEFYLKLMIDGISSTPFSARGTAPMLESDKTGNDEKVIRITRERYAKNREVVEDRIMRWSMGTDDEELSDEIVVPAASPGNTVAAAVPNVVAQQVNINQPAAVLPGNKPYAQPVPRPSTPIVSNQPVANKTQVNSSFANPVTAPLPKKFEPSKKVSNKPTFDVVCAKCSKITQTIFQPDGVRPVYCKDCLEIVRSEKKGETDSRKALKEAELSRLAATQAPAAIEQSRVAETAPLTNEAQATASAPVVNEVVAPVVNQAITDGGTIKTAGGGTITFVKAVTPTPPAASSEVNVVASENKDDEKVVSENGEHDLSQGETINLN